jgi:predicted  nucleic acid-binding Zn-ribbon protein
VAIDLDLLKSERDKLKEGLREVEGELRKLEAQLKVLRQREIQTKREIEAVSTLIDSAAARGLRAWSRRARARAQTRQAWPG